MLGRVGQRLSPRLGLLPCSSTALEGSQRSFAVIAGKGKPISLLLWFPYLLSAHDSHSSPRHQHILPVRR